VGVYVGVLVFGWKGVSEAVKVGVGVGVSVWVGVKVTVFVIVIVSGVGLSVGDMGCPVTVSVTDGVGVARLSGASDRATSPMQLQGMVATMIAARIMRKRDFGESDTNILGGL